MGARICSSSSFLSGGLSVGSVVGAAAVGESAANATGATTKIKAAIKLRRAEYHSPMLPVPFFAPSGHMNRSAETGKWISGERHGGIGLWSILRRSQVIQRYDQSPMT